MPVAERRFVVDVPDALPPETEELLPVVVVERRVVPDWLPCWLAVEEEEEVRRF